MVWFRINSDFNLFVKIEITRYLKRAGSHKYFQNFGHIHSIIDRQLWLQSSCANMVWSIHHDMNFTTQIIAERMKLCMAAACIIGSHVSNPKKFVTWSSIADGITTIWWIGITIFFTHSTGEHLTHTESSWSRALIHTIHVYVVIISTSCIPDTDFGWERWDLR